MGGEECVREVAFLVQILRMVLRKVLPSFADQSLNSAVDYSLVLRTNQ